MVARFQPKFAADAIQFVELKLLKGIVGRIGITTSITHGFIQHCLEQVITHLVVMSLDVFALAMKCIDSAHSQNLDCGFKILPDFLVNAVSKQYGQELM